MKKIAIHLVGKFFVTLFVLAGYSGQLYGQEVHTSFSYDTVYVGNMLAVKYSMENWQADMSNPEFGEFEVAGGPQMSSSMSVSGGERTSSKSIMLYLRPPEQPGEYVLPPVTFKGEDQQFSTKEKTIIVLANPNGIRQEPVIENYKRNNTDRQYKRSSPPRGERQRF